jgi:hypothetical protein
MKALRLYAEPGPIKVGALYLEQPVKWMNQDYHAGVVHWFPGHKVKAKWRSNIFSWQEFLNIH